MNDAWTFAQEPGAPPESIPSGEPTARLRQRYDELAGLLGVTARLDVALERNTLLHEIFGGAMQITHAHSGSLMLVDPASNQLYIAQSRALPPAITAATQIPLGEGIAGWVAQQRQGILLIGRVDNRSPQTQPERTPLIGSSICAPIVSMEPDGGTTELLGILNLNRAVHAPLLTEDDLRLVTAYCAHTATVLRNARFCRSLQRRAQQLQHQVEIGRTLLASLEVDVVLQAIMRKAVELLRSESGSLFLVDERTDELVFKVVIGPAREQLLDKRLPPGAGIVGAVAKEGKPLIVNDAKADPRHYDGVDLNTTLVTNSIVCVPLISRARVIGVIEVMNKSNGAPFDADDRDSLNALAIQSAIALENAQLYSDLKRAFAETVRAIANALEARDPYTHGHTNRVTQVAMELAHELNWTREQKEALEFGALLHDIGKIGVADVILRKPGSLTTDEYSEMKQHPVVGAQMLKGVQALRPMLPYVLFHQERYDGQGYPFGLGGKEIPLEGRLLAVADTFDAMTSNRPYRRALSDAEALREIERNSGTQFDPDIVNALLAVHYKGKLGTTGK